ncbi:MAG TPA: tetratricopeptide repeat protein, partial [Terracidiphilus sp.]|nr:tetratricopeptide repeat protein [Terracidiphilus sp.]
THKGAQVFDETADVAPGKPFTRTTDVPFEDPAAFHLRVFGEDGRELIGYQPEAPAEHEPPVPATEPPPPAQIESIEELYLTGLHLEQYRHATRSPEVYWREGLRRDEGDARLNNAMGLSLFRKGLFAEAEQHFERAVRRLSFRNPNPYDGEPFYNLGLARLYQGKVDAAYDAFHKAVWSYAWQSAGYFKLAAISVRRGNLPLALEQVERSLSTNVDNLAALALKSALLRRMGDLAEARSVVAETLARDPLCFRTLAERFLLSRSGDDLHAFVTALEGDVQTLLDITFELAWCGLSEDALLLLERVRETAHFDHPMIGYTLAWLAAGLDRQVDAAQFIADAEAASPLYCFPARLEEMIVLEDAIARRSESARAHYYLGNLYYDKRRYEDAICCWRTSVALDPDYSVSWRNLGLAEFNILHDPAAADHMYARACAADPRDARLLYEWDQLKKRASLATPQERLYFLEQHPSLVDLRDDLTVELVTLLNQVCRHVEALNELSARRFSPWEGGEGLVSAQYVHAHKALGRAAFAAADPAEALRHFDAARRYPKNLGEGKHLLTLERDLDYFSGLAAAQLGDKALAQQCFKAAAAPLTQVGYHSFFRGLALRALGRGDDASMIFSELLEFAKTQMQSEVKIDYFATSLPNFLIFEDDLVKRHSIDCAFLSALAHYGLGQIESAVEELEQVVADDPNHLAALEIAHWIKSGTALALATVEAESLR